MNDWGCAEMINTKVEFAGALQLAHQSYLKNPTHNYTTSAGDDLEMFVKFLYVLQNPFDVLPSEPAQLFVYWEKRLELVFWANLMRLARSRNYEMLKTEISKFLI